MSIIICRPHYPTLQFRFSTLLPPLSFKLSALPWLTTPEQLSLSPNPTPPPMTPPTTPPLIPQPPILPPKPKPFTTPPPPPR